MHKKDTRTLDKLFSHPIPMNLEWNEVKHMLEIMGATIDTTHHSHIKVNLAGETRTFKTFHKNLGDKHEILELQHLIRDAGMAPKAT